MMNLIVLRTGNVEACKRFYESLGLTFVEEQHGSGPVHYSCIMGSVVMEIYPACKVYPTYSTCGITLGFKVTAEQLALGHKIKDPDGRTIYLSE